MSTNVKVDKFIDALRSRILSGEFGADGRLPSFRALATEYGTTQETMNKTMQALQAEGLLISKGAKGVFVSTGRIRVPAMVANFYQHIKKYGLEAKEQLVNKPEVITPSKELIKNMLLPKDTKVLRRFRKQGSAQTAFRLAESFYPISLINDAMLEQIYKDKHFHIINAIKENFKKEVEFAHEEIICRLPTPFEQEQLGIVRTNPVIEMRVTNLTEDKKTVIMYSNVVFNANLFLLYYDYKLDSWN